MYHINYYELFSQKLLMIVKRIFLILMRKKWFVTLYVIHVI